jgi:hypothetical protein
MGGRHVPRLFPWLIQPCREVVPNVTDRLKTDESFQGTTHRANFEVLISFVAKLGSASRGINHSGPKTSIKRS